MRQREVDKHILTYKDFTSKKDVRWCAGCGDYSILTQIRNILPKLKIPKENLVFISGIGCSSRLPYYLNTFGIHSIHGRAPTIATGLKCSRSELEVFVITGDGDGLSIGANHLLHAMRRNININIILFNNRTYGLTKGQYSPTSEAGKVTKSSPFGSLDYPLRPLSVAISAEATFVARSIDGNGNHLAHILERAAQHKGISFVEVYQNCVIFNNGAFSYGTEWQIKDDNILILENGKPMIFGKNQDKGIRINPATLYPEIVKFENGFSKDDLLIHDENAPEPTLAYFLSRFTYPEFPEPIGVLRAIRKPTYDEMFNEQIRAAQSNRKKSFQDVIEEGEVWEIK